MLGGENRTGIVLSYLKAGNKNFTFKPNKRTTLLLIFALYKCSIKKI